MDKNKAEPYIPMDNKDFIKNTDKTNNDYSEFFEDNEIWDDNCDVKYEYNGQRFEWDSNKENLNIKNHDGISFKEAAVCYMDRDVIFLEDKKYVDVEERFKAIGALTMFRTLIVHYCLRNNEDVIRIFSAREISDNEMEHLLNEY